MTMRGLLAMGDSLISVIKWAQTGQSSAGMSMSDLSARPDIAAQLRGGGMSNRGENAVAARRIQGVLKELRTQLDDNGKVYKRALRAIKRAGQSAQTTAIMLLPYESDLPSGFTRVSNDGWAKSRTNRTAAFPHFERRAAREGIKIQSLRGKAKMTERGWIGSGVNGIEIVQSDAAANIFDIAGTKGGVTAAGKRLIGLFDNASRFNAPLYRVLLPAVIETRPEIIHEIERALDAAQKALDRAGGDY